MSAIRCTSLLEDGTGEEVSKGQNWNSGLDKVSSPFFAGFFLFFWTDRLKLRNGLLTASDYRGAWRE